jgi:hypothetical protein
VDKQEQLLQLVSQRINWDTLGYIKAPAKPEWKANLKAEDNEVIKSEKEYKEALAYIKDVIAPAFMKIYPNKIEINNTIVKTFFVYAYPNFLEWNWLSPIINWDVKFDMSLFVYPIDSAFIQKYLKKRLTQLYSERSINAEKWLLNDPAVDAQIQDVEELRQKLTRWEEKYFHLW